MDKLYIVIPAYNEQDNIEQVINDWYPVIEKHNGNGQSRLIVIDDGSKDSTYEKLKQCTKTRPLLISITKPNGGHGATVLYGYKYALKNGADYIFQSFPMLCILDRIAIVSNCRDFGIRTCQQFFRAQCQLIKVSPLQ